MFGYCHTPRSGYERVGNLEAKFFCTLPRREGLFGHEFFVFDNALWIGNRRSDEAETQIDVVAVWLCVGRIRYW